MAQLAKEMDSYIQELDSQPLSFLRRFRYLYGAPIVPNWWNDVFWVPYPAQVSNCPKNTRAYGYFRSCRWLEERMKQCRDDARLIAARLHLLQTSHPDSPQIILNMEDMHNHVRDFERLLTRHTEMNNRYRQCCVDMNCTFY